MGWWQRQKNQTRRSSPTVKQSVGTRLRNLLLPKKTEVQDKTTIMVAIDHSGKLSKRPEQKTVTPRAERGYRRSSTVKEIMEIDRQALRRSALGHGLKGSLPPIEKEEEVEITLVYTVRESKIIINPFYQPRGDGFRVIEKTFKVPRSDMAARRIVNGLNLAKKEDEKKETDKKTENKEKKKTGKWAKRPKTALRRVSMIPEL